MKFTTIGCYVGDESGPLVTQVDVARVEDAIREERRIALENNPTPGAEYKNLFVLAGWPEVLSTWAG